MQVTTLGNTEFFYRFGWSLRWRSMLLRILSSTSSPIGRKIKIMKEENYGYGSD